MASLPTYHIAFSSTRYVSFERVTRNRIHRHSFFEPCIVISGKGEFEHASEVWALREGDLFIADPGIYHEIRSLNTRDLKLYFLAFNVTRAPETALPHEQAWLSRQTLDRFVLEHSVHLPSQSHLIPLFEHVMKLSRHDVSQQQSCFYREASLLLMNQIAAALTDSARLAEEDHRDHLLKNRVVEAIEQRLHAPLKIAKLARDCGMSERTLRRRWKNWGGRSLTEEINHRRIERASHLLLLPDISIAEVGYQVGIDNPGQFSRTFSLMKGLAPKAYRKKYMSRPPGVLSGPPFRTEFLDGELKEYHS